MLDYSPACILGFLQAAVLAGLLSCWVLLIFWATGLLPCLVCCCVAGNSVLSYWVAGVLGCCQTGLLCCWTAGLLS